MTYHSLELQDVVKTFGPTTAVNGLSLTVPEASVFALLGPNGAGKTTTIEMCEGFQKPTSGSIRVLGLDPVTQTDELRRRVGIMLQGGGAYPGIRVREMLQLVASFSRNPLDVDWLLDLVGLQRHERTSYRRLSGGQQQRLSLACALVGRPELVFLDEPTAGLDAQSRLTVWDLIRSLRRDGVTVVLTTHLMDEAEALADRVMIIDRGVTVAQGTTAELTARAERTSISIETNAELDTALIDAALAPFGATITANRPLSYRVEAAATPAVVHALAQSAAEQRVLIHSLEVNRLSLEDVFLDITGREMRN
ncbi:ABC transporter ATP-binding protein [Corynebacterium sp.]|uniref:ABC transporter ATP-binding protein n=1 Tax=Corynebacterium sp. TaxID=1720 RepID=UPI0026DB4773|nr:ABC transporter ATP-binding protein [Corynebacterium sp.]MDO5077462.1 ABC transporter ATP-binding protein [Corynebacterium sp.]